MVPKFSEVLQEQYVKFSRPIWMEPDLLNQRNQCKMKTWDSCLLQYNFTTRKTFRDSRNQLFTKIKLIPSKHHQTQGAPALISIYLIGETFFTLFSEKSFKLTIWSFWSGEPRRTFGEPLYLCMVRSEVTNLNFSVPIWIFATGFDQNLRFGKLWNEEIMSRNLRNRHDRSHQSSKISVSRLVFVILHGHGDLKRSFHLIE